MNVVEYQITGGTPFKNFWLLLPHPILVRVGQFLLLDPKYQKTLTARYSKSITLIGTPTVPRLTHAWYEVRNTQTTPPPFAPFMAEESSEGGVESIGSDKSMSSVSRKKRKRVVA